MRRHLFRRNRAGHPARVVVATMAGPAAFVVAPAPVAQLVEAVAPILTVSVVATLDEVWTGLGTGQLDPRPALVVLMQPPDESVARLAESIAYFAPHTAVVLLHPRADLEELGEQYQQVVAAHPDMCDLDAPVEVVHDEPPTGAAIVAALRAALPNLPVLDCPPLLAGPIFTAVGRPTRDADTGYSAHLAPVEAAASSRGVVVAVASAKGGAGKSTTAVALAGTLAADGKRVCLVDLDLRDGQLATLLDASLPTIASLARESAGINDATVLAHLTRNDHLNVSALLAPASGDDPDVRDPMLHRHILTVLRRHFDVIVLDCPVTYRDQLLAHTAFVEADKVIAVSTLAVTSLAGLRRMLHALTDSPSAAGLGVPRRKFGVVVNGALNGVAVDRGQVDDHTAGVPVVAVVPHVPRDALIATNRRRLDLLVTHPDLAPAYRDLAAWCLEPIPAARRVARRRSPRRRVA